MSGEQQPAHRGGGGGDRTLVFGGVVLVLGLFGMAVALAFAGWKMESIIGLTGGLGTVAGVLLAALSKLGTISNKVDQVAHQTNGVLRQTVAQEASTQVRAALTDHGLPPVPPAGRARPRGRGGSHPAA